MWNYRHMDATECPPAGPPPSPPAASPRVPLTSGPPEQTVAAAAWQALSQPGRITGMIAAALPSAIFLTVDALASLYPALAAAGVVAAAGFAWRLHRRQPLRQALAGVVIVAACAGVAAVTGQERGFFLIPALIPFVVIAVCVASVMARRPLTGVLLNRVSGGPADWREIDRLRRVYTATTLAAAAVNVVNATVQAIFYLANYPAVLAAAHVATGPVFAVIVAVTIVLARRAMAVARPASP
jgi:Protein of unknown function (DUF3159)